MTTTTPQLEAHAEDALRLLRAEQARLGPSTWLLPTAVLMDLRLGPIRFSQVVDVLEARGLIEVRTNPNFRVRLRPTRTRQLAIQEA